MLQSFWRQSVKLLLGLGIWAGMQGLLSAQYYPAQPYCPVPYPPYNPYGPYAPQGPRTPMLPAPPTSASPTPVPTPTQPTRPTQPTQPDTSTPPSTTPAASATEPTSAGQLPAIQADGGAPSNDAISETATIASIGMQGRGDFLNRFNIFDNNSAAPTNRTWFGFQALDKFQTGFGNNNDPNLPLTQRRNEYLYRGGVEIALGNLLSFTAQGQYVSSVGTNDNFDAWANPMFALKWAAIFTESTVISPVLAFQPNTGQRDDQLHDRSARIYPGLLFFETLGGNCFLQGGGQFGITTGSGSDTVDYGLSLGMWLYRDSSLDVAGRRTDPFERSALPFCTGVIPQLELYGKNVISGASRQPFDPTLPDQVDNYFSFKEAENVYNMTAGCRFLFINHLSLSLGYSRAISGGYVSKNEFLTTLNVNF